MPKILITGNGFDLNYGLPTSYRDFIKFLNCVEKNEVDFDSVYSKSFSWNVISRNFSQFSLDSKKIEILKNQIDDNIWYQFFKTEFEIETWIDFENKIEYVLKILFSSTEYLKNNIFSKGSINEDNLYYGPQLFNNNIEILHVLNNFDIVSLDDSYSVFLNETYLIKKYDFYIDIDINKIAKNLYEELIDFKKIFNYFFEIFIFPFYDNMQIKTDRTLFSSINKHYTFNYTPTFEKVFKKANITNFLHGKVDSALNKIVLGINEIPNNELNQKYFLPFTKYFQKLDNTTDYIFIKDFEKRKRSNFMFFFWGHSLDKSDQDYINEVFDFINNLKSRVKKIIIIYHNESSKSQLLINLLDIRGKDDIQELMKNKILELYHIDSKELKRELKRDITSPSYSATVI